jgi:mevalonate kinase
VSSTGEAPGKVILVGEHAVVYGLPAIAVPVWEARATATVSPRAQGAGCIICAHDIEREIELSRADDREPLALVARLVLRELSMDPDPDLQIDVRSQIPIASGMGSGAAVGAAIVRALYMHAGVVPADSVVSALVYRGEEVHHGTPSGIDNTVVAYGKPVWFVRGKAPEVFTPPCSFTLVIADSGVPSSTLAMVAGVRSRHDASPNEYNAWFGEIAEIVANARRAMETGNLHELGELFNLNQDLLELIGVSTPDLERLVEAARVAGASGAKLSGGGGGGNIIALVADYASERVANALIESGAKRVIVTLVGARG